MSASKVPHIISERTHERELKLRAASHNAPATLGQSLNSSHVAPQLTFNPNGKKTVNERNQQALMAEVHLELLEEDDWDPINPDDLTPPPQVLEAETQEPDVVDHGVSQPLPLYGEVSSSASDHSEQASMMSAYFSQPGPDSQGLSSPRFEVRRPAECYFLASRGPHLNPYIPATYYEELHAHAPATSSVWAFNPYARTFRVQRPQYHSGDMFQQWMFEAQNTTQYLQMTPAPYMRDDFYDGPLSGRSDSTLVPDAMVTERVGTLPLTYSPQRRRRLLNHRQNF